MQMCVGGMCINVCRWNVYITVCACGVDNVQVENMCIYTLKTYLQMRFEMAGILYINACAGGILYINACSGGIRHV